MLTLHRQLNFFLFFPLHVITRKQNYNYFLSFFIHLQFHLRFFFFKCIETVAKTASTPINFLSHHQHHSIVSFFHSFLSISFHLFFSLNSVIRCFCIHSTYLIFIFTSFVVVAAVIHCIAFIVNTTQANPKLLFIYWFGLIWFWTYFRKISIKLNDLPTL